MTPFFQALRYASGSTAIGLLSRWGRSLLIAHRVAEDSRPPPAPTERGNMCPYRDPSSLAFRIHDNCSRKKNCVCGKKLPCLLSSSSHRFRFLKWRIWGH
jgi:hypothetical protein